VEDKESGNGDGVAQTGEVLNLVLNVTNQGKGATAEAFARVKNKAGRALDIQRGTLEPGYMVDDAGKRCEVILPGVENGKVVGDVSKGAERVEAGDPPTYPEGCKRVLAPGESWTGSFQVVAQKVHDRSLEVEISMGDAEAYDHASIMRLGFYGYFTNIQKVKFDLDEPLPSGVAVKTPTIEISRKPDMVVDSQETTISGVVRDDEGIASVMLFHGQDKVFFEGSGQNSQLKSVPFSADLDLEPGLNTITVLVMDSQEAKATASVVVFYAADEAKAESRIPETSLPK